MKACLSSLRRHRPLSLGSVFLLLLLLPAMSQAALVMHLPLDNTLNDASGNGNNGSFPGGAENPVFAPAVINQGLQFDGNNDYISVADFDPGSTFSVALWVRLDHLNNLDTYVEHVRTNRRNDFFVGYDRAQNQLFVELEDTNTTEGGACGDPKFCTGIRLDDDRWYHVTVTVTPTTLNVYIDAELAYSANHNTNVTFDPGIWLIGGDSDSNPYQQPETDYTEGRMDDIRIYSHELTQAEISEIIGLRGNWRLDDCSWATGAAVADSSGNNLNGVVQGTLAPGSGQICGAASLPGNDADFINIDNNALLNITDELTVMAWIRPDRLPNSGLMTIGSNDWNYEFHVNSSGRIYWWWNDAGGNVHTLTSSTRISAGNWYHVAIVYSRSGAFQRIYINGQQAASSNRNEALRVFNGPLQIGADQGFSGRNFDGLIDEFRVYRRALTGEEIEDYVNDPDPIPRRCPVCSPGGNLIAWYALDETAWTGAAGEVIDGTGNGNNGQALSNNVATNDAAPAIPGDPGTCRYGEFPASTGATVYDAVDTGVDIDDTVGSVGTVTFWYKSNANWRGGGDRMLLDASRAGSDNKYFFLMLRNDGRLRFGLEDSADRDFRFNSRRFRFRAGTWVHVAITWDLPNRRMQILVNGGSPQRYLLSSNTTRVIGELNSLYLGDNRTTYLVGGMTGNAANGSIDEVRIYNVVRTRAEIQNDMTLTHPCIAGGLDHLLIQHDGAALTCQPEDVTVLACANADCSTLYTSAVDVTLSPPGWVGGDTQTIQNGSATFQLRRTTPGVVTLDATATNPVAAGATVCANSGAGDASCTLEFFDSGFVFDVPTPQTSCQVSPQVMVRAVRKDDSTQRCVPAFSNRSGVPVAFSASYVNPATGTVAPMVGSGGTDYTLPATVPLDFDVNGEAPITVRYNDAGEIAVTASYTGSGAEAGLVMTGTDNFVTIPEKFYVFAPDPAGACPTNDVACTLFRRTDQSFDLTVRAACADNSVTPNFALNGITIGHDNTAPNIAEGSIAVSSANITSGGEVTLAQSVSEVGVFTFTATPPVVSNPASPYFGLTLNGGTSTYIGRFAPDHFAISGSALTNRSNIAACTDGFTYMDEPFAIDFTLSARNAGNLTTLNYSGAFALLDPAVMSNFNFGATDGSTNLSARLTATTTGAFNNGSALVNAQLRLLRQASPDGPFDPLIIGALPTDSDGVTLVAASLDLSLNGTAPATHQSLGSTAVRFGRLVAENAFGSEFLALAMPLQAHYYSDINNGFVLNTSDNCTTLAVSNLTLFNNVEAGQTDGDIQITAGNTTTATLTDGNGAVAGIQFSSGDAGLGFSAPNVAGYTDVDVDASVVPFLRFDWDGDGVHDNDPPTVRATFGAYRGDDRIIYRQECFGLNPPAACP